MTCNETNQETERCERCKEPLKADRIVWLELSQTDARYYERIPEGHESQGGFPFGIDCATRANRPFRSRK